MYTEILNNVSNSLIISSGFKIILKKSFSKSGKVFMMVKKGYQNVFFGTIRFYAEYTIWIKSG